METIAKAYFLINFLGAIWAAIYSTTERSRKNVPKMVLDEVDSMTKKQKIFWGVITFVMNLLMFLPLKMFRPWLLGR